MRTLCSVMVVLIGISSVQAATCGNRYASDYFGDKSSIVEFLDVPADTPDVKITSSGKALMYTSRCGGSPVVCVLDPVNDNEEPLGWIEHKGDLIIDMQVYEPYCRIQ